MRSRSVGLALLLLLGLPASFASTMGQELLNVTMHVVDANGGSLSGAVLQISDYGSVVTGDSGIVQLQLRSGVYAVSVSFMSVPVFSGNITVTSSSTVQLRCSVFRLDVTVTGAPTDGQLLGVAKVAGKVVVAKGKESSVRFHQLPKGPVSISIFAVTGNLTRLIAERTLQLDRNIALTLAASSYRMITVQVVDLSGLPIADATVRVGDHENVTDAAGRTVVYAVDGYHTANITLYDVPIFERNIRVTGDASWVVNASASTLEATFIDENSEPVPTTPILLRVGTRNVTLTADAKGTVRLTQIPHGPISASAIGVGVPAYFTFEGVAVTVRLVAHRLEVYAEPVRAYMLGPLTVKVEVRLGKLVVKNATVIMRRGVATVAKSETRGGFALLTTPIALEPNIAVTIEATAYGQLKSRELTVGANPMIPATMPLAFAPIIIFEFLRRRIRSRLRAPTPPRRRRWEVAG